MEIFTVTPRALTTLRGIAKLNAKGAEEFSNFLAAHLEILSAPAEAYALSQSFAFQHIDAETAFLWLDSIVPFIFEVLPTGSDANETSAGLVASAQRVAKKTADGPFSAGAAKKLGANLLAIFDNPITRLKAKALKLLNSHERGFVSCQIYSDIRPVFKVDGAVDIEAAVVYHTLKLEHSGSGGDFCISLDSKDLSSLQKAIERAIEKERALSKLIGKAGIEQIKVA